MLNRLKQFMNRVVGWPKAYLNEKWRWENYRDFFNLTVFRYLVLWFSLVPLLASLLAGLKPPIVIPIGEHEITLGLAIPFYWQILWLSSMFFFLALALYKWKCPDFIKKYHTFSEYTEIGHDLRWIVYEVRFLKLSGEDLSDFTEKLKTKKFASTSDEPLTAKPVVQEKQTIYRYLSGQRNAGETVQVGAPVLDSAGDVVADAERGLFWEIFAAFSGSRVRMRGLILGLLFLSAICFAVVLVQHMMHGWDYVWGWLQEWWPLAMHWIAAHIPGLSKP